VSQTVSLTTAQATALRVCQAVGPCRYASATSYERGSVSGAIADGLAEQGLVAITKGRIALTDAGRQALDER
jgi:ribosomal protein S19E (S16A)